MKQKSFFIVLAALLVSFSAFADTAISIGPAFTNYFVRTKMQGDLTSQVQNIVQLTANNMYEEKNNAAGFALDVRGDLFYGMLQMAFPGKSHNDIFKSDTNSIKNSAIIFDSQLGLGITLFKNNPLNLFIGGGVGLNTMYANSKVKIPAVGEVEYAKLDFMLGAGANVLAQLYITKHIGVYAGIADTVYFLPLVITKKFNFPGSEVSYNNKSDLKNTLANSLNVKAGLTIKL